MPADRDSHRVHLKLMVVPWLPDDETYRWDREAEISSEFDANNLTSNRDGFVFPVSFALIPDAVDMEFFVEAHESDAAHMVLEPEYPDLGDGCPPWHFDCPDGILLLLLASCLEEGCLESFIEYELHRTKTELRSVCDIRWLVADLLQ